MFVKYLPSPDRGVWNLGPLPIRAYALCIIAGAIVAIWLGGRRWEARGGRREVVGDVALWAIPFGIVGARAYHVMTDPELYFDTGTNSVDILKVWQGGLGIWGAVAAGGLGAYVGCRRHGVGFRDFADALAPGILLAQAIGRWGNYFNQELFGKPTKLPWGLEIDPGKRPAGYEQFATFHPTFLYESLWNLAGVWVILWASQRFDLRQGRTFALYVMVYTAGRGWIEMLRIDTANHLGPLRLNVWTSMVVFLAAAAYFATVRVRERRRTIEPGRSISR